MRYLSGVFLSALLGLALPATAAPDAKLDIAGVRIGMTEAEVRAALTAFDPSLTVTAVASVFNYRDGVNMLQSPEFLDRLEGKVGRNGDPNLKVYFSGPVGEVRVIGVSRAFRSLDAPPTSAQFLQSLAAKYGPLSGFSRDNQRHPVWESDGRPSCIRGRGGMNNAVWIDLDSSFGPGLVASSSAQAFLSARSSAVTHKGLLPTDLTQCGAYLGYYYFGDPVRSFEAELFDLGAVVATQRSREAWVNQLQADAVRKREGQGQTPKL